jgi:hypothetical protein
MQAQKIYPIIDNAAVCVYSKYIPGDLIALQLYVEKIILRSDFIICKQYMFSAFSNRLLHSSRSQARYNSISRSPQGNK